MLVVSINENRKQVFEIKMFLFIFNLISFIISLSILYINVMLTTRISSSFIAKNTVHAL